jgi:hypothetical protein
MDEPLSAGQPEIHTNKGVRLDPRPDVWGEPVPTWVVWCVLGGFGSGIYLMAAISAGGGWSDAVIQILFIALVVWIAWVKVWPAIKDLLTALTPLVVALWRLALVGGFVWLVLTAPMTAIALALVAIAVLLYVLVLQRSQ